MAVTEIFKHIRKYKLFIKKGIFWLFVVAVEDFKSLGLFISYTVNLWGFNYLESLIFLILDIRDITNILKAFKFLGFQECSGDWKCYEDFEDLETVG